MSETALRSQNQSPVPDLERLGDVRIRDIEAPENTPAAAGHENFLHRSLASTVGNRNAATSDG